jgi:hypothetical protein
MAKNKNRAADSKDSAAKNTLNPQTSDQPRGRPAPDVTEEQPDERPIGQFTGRGTPGLQKK